MGVCFGHILKSLRERVSSWLGQGESEQMLSRTRGKAQGNIFSPSFVLFSVGFSLESYV